MFWYYDPPLSDERNNQTMTPFTQSFYGQEKNDWVRKLSTFVLLWKKTMCRLRLSYALKKLSCAWRIFLGHCLSTRPNFFSADTERECIRSTILQLDKIKANLSFLKFFNKVPTFSSGWIRSNRLYTLLYDGAYRTILHPSNEHSQLDIDGHEELVTLSRIVPEHFKAPAPTPDPQSTTSSGTTLSTSKRSTALAQKAKENVMSHQRNHCNHHGIKIVPFLCRYGLFYQQPPRISIFKGKSQLLAVMKSSRI